MGPLATLQELEHLGVGFVSLTEALDLTTPAGRAMAGLLAVLATFEMRDSAGEDQGWFGARSTERATVGSAGNRGRARCRNPEPTSRRRQQIGDRPPSAKRFLWS